jgi:CRISPR-associated endonuclease/helicase Cas3
LPIHNLTEPWAKTNSGDTRSVFEHSFDVAITVRDILNRDIGRRRLSTAFGRDLREPHLARLSVLAGLHDFGKTLKGFQDKLDGLPGTSSGHVAEALAVLSAVRETHDAIGIDLLRNWFNGPTDAVYAAVCHHGEPVGDDRIRRHLNAVRDLLQPTRFGHDPLTEMRRLKERLLQAFPAALTDAEPLNFAPAAQHLFAGILMVADWMASGFAFEPGDRHTLAEQLLNRTGWSGWHSGAEPRALLGGWSPRAAQAAVEIAPLEKLLVIEAPTGTGKTEAALIWASRLVEANLVDGLYFAVPTRSAATELHARIGHVMAGQHPLLEGKIVRAVPGMLDVDARPDYPPETWAVAAPKRVFAAPIAVGTIDQALLSDIRTRHAWLRAALLSRHLLVIDEVHASDPYMSALTNALVRRHLDLGGYVLAMSATLGETALAELQGRPRRPFRDAVQVAYPAVRAPSGDIALNGVVPSSQPFCVGRSVLARPPASRHLRAAGQPQRHRCCHNANGGAVSRHRRRSFDYRRLPS